VTVAISQNRTRRRFKRRARDRVYVATDLGREVCGQILPTLASHMVSDDAPQPPEWLEPVRRQLKPEELALVALGPLLEQIDKGWDWDDPSARMKIHLALGKALRDKADMDDLRERDEVAYDRVMAADNKHRTFSKHRRLNWTDPQCCEAGIWLMDCACDLDFFDIDEGGFPKIADDHQEAIDRLRDELIQRDPVHLPMLERPQPWTDWDVGGSPIQTTFVRDSYPDVEKNIREAFACKRESEWRFRHADGVNHSQSVAWRINEAMLPVVRCLAGAARGDGRWGGVGKSVSRNQVWRDLATARWLAGKPFWVPMNCDFRGRMYGIPHFNFMREDYVRSLFLFDQGMEIGRDASWLLIHLANCFDDVDGDVTISKRAWDRRVDWAQNHMDMIARTARNPEDTVDWWRKADAPFSFVAACMECVAASEDPGYITRLPITLDATCNGVQHLAALSRDEVTGARTNLTDGELQDAYHDIVRMVITRVTAEHNKKSSALFWLAENRLNRKLIKRPATTFGYSVTTQGMADQIVEEYQRQHGGNKPDDTAAWYLAHRIMDACKGGFKKPAEVMDFIRAVAEHLAEHNLPLRWTPPTGFPVISAYYPPKLETVDNALRGERVRFRVADGWLPTMGEEYTKKAINAATANFTHSIDSSHAVRVINAAVAEGITNVATIHDCYVSLAPQVQELHRIVRREFFMLHAPDLLSGLRDFAWGDLWHVGPLSNERAATACKLLLEPMPRHGSLDLAEVQRSEYMTS